MVEEERRSLTGSGIVSELHLPVEGRLDRQRTRLRDIHNFKMTRAVCRLQLASRSLGANGRTYSELGPVPDCGNICFKNHRTWSRRVSRSVMYGRVNINSQAKPKAQQ
jgi:hypothetical protein